ncbi:hypothetical protein J6590_090569 [Homalodisca vitripennis]|nr:hypothetical protein J6590_090262 [Homalodisca vitripennis]KAG8293919.1 hypothetical protein J6590_007584 [Homalodisca vitripennis]KAG8329254.1 hypothetical protein J6590_090569 [Homalodisca vitripennis]
MSGEESGDLEALNQIVNDCIMVVGEENAHLRQEFKVENVLVSKTRDESDVKAWQYVRSSNLVRQVPVPSKLKLDGNMREYIQHFRKMFSNYSLAARLCDRTSLSNDKTGRQWSGWGRGKGKPLPAGSFSSGP